MAKKQVKPKRLDAAIPGEGGRFYRDSDGSNLMSEQEHQASKTKEVTNTGGENS